MKQDAGTSRQDATLMAAGGGADLAAVRELARAALRAAISAELCGYPSGPEAQPLLCEACRVARTAEIKIERLLVVLKEAWFELPPARHRACADSQATLAGLVTLCIKEYYATGHPT